MANKIDPKRPINGITYNATEDGFERLVEDANRGHKAGYALVSVVELQGKKLGALFFRRTATSGTGGSSLFGE